MAQNLANRGRTALAVIMVACASCLAVVAPADAAQETTIYRFHGSPDGGTMYKVTPRDAGGRMTPWNYVNIYTFSNVADGDPESLVSTLLPDGRFALFGVTANRFANPLSGAGTVFEVIP